MTGAARLTLAIDCSTAFLALALVDDHGAVIATRTREVGRQHAALITIELSELFASARVPRDAVSWLRVGVGPGSYTGVRVAVAAAKGLARAWGVEVRGVYSLLALAGPELAVGQRGVVTSDARRGHVYAQPCARRAAGGAAAGSTTDTPSVTAAGTVVSLGPPVKLPGEAVAGTFPGWLLLPAGPPDAAVLAATPDTTTAEPVYL